MEIQTRTHSGEPLRPPPAHQPGLRPGISRRATLLNVAALAVALTLSGVQPLPAANPTWNGGGTDDNWQTANNWGGTAPSGGDLLFFAGTSRLANNNDLSSLAIGSLTFNNTAGAFTLGGNAVNLGGGITNNSASLQTINLGLNLTANSSINAASGDITINGVIGPSGGSYGLTNLGSRTLTLAGVNTFGGGTTLVKGTLAIGNDGALGTGTLQFGVTGSTITVGIQSADSTAHTIANELALAGSGVVLTFGAPSGGTGDLTFTGNFSLASSGSPKRTFIVNNTTTFNGVLSGGGTTLIKDGNGTLVLTGANTYGGGTTNKAGVVAINADSSLGGGPLSLAGGTLSNAVDVTLAPARSVTLDSGGGTFAAASGATLTIGQVISGSGGLTKSGAGTLTLNKANTYSGGTTLRAGVLKLGVDNAIPSSGTFEFAGGLLDANNRSAHMGPLSLTADSTIQLHADSTPGTLTFGSGSRSAGTLTIDNWTGTPGTGGSDDRIVIGSSPTLDATFLANVMWTHLNGGGSVVNGALQLGDGTLAPVPEIKPFHAAGLLVGLFGWTERRRLRRFFLRARLRQTTPGRLTHRTRRETASDAPGSGIAPDGERPKEVGFGSRPA